MNSAHIPDLLVGCSVQRNSPNGSGPVRPTVLSCGFPEFLEQVASIA